MRKASENLLRFAPLLLCLGCGKPSHPTLSLHEAIKARNVAQVESNLYWGCDVNAKAGEPAMTSVQTAASVGDMRIAKLLVERGSATYDPEDALFGNDAATVAYLLNRQTLAPSKAVTFYLTAMKHGSVEGVRYLAAHHIDPNARDGNRANQSVLHWFASDSAVLYESRDPDRFTALFSALIDAGTNINATDDTGITPLGRAVEDQNEFAEKLLRSRGAIQRGDQQLESMRAQIQADQDQRERDAAEASRRVEEQSDEEARRRAEEDRRNQQEAAERWRQEQAFLNDQDAQASSGNSGQ